MFSRIESRPFMYIMLALEKCWHVNKVTLNIIMTAAYPKNILIKTIPNTLTCLDLINSRTFLGSTT